MKEGMCHLMVDLETMGTGFDAPIVQIGAIYFDIADGRTRSPFKINIDLDNAIRHGAKPDGRTIYWWMQQSMEARRSVVEAGVPELEALREFNTYASNAKYIWSHATFDFVILMTRLHARGIRPLIHYRQARDIRTLTSLAGKKRDDIESAHPRDGVHHDALADAEYQVKYCCEAYQCLKHSSELQDGALSPGL